MPYYPMALQMNEIRETKLKNEQRKYKKQLAKATKLQKKVNGKKYSIVIQKYWRRFIQRRLYWKRKKKKRQLGHKVHCSKIENNENLVIVSLY